jgi:hypothetical protein
MKNELGTTTILDIKTTNDYLDDVKKIVVQKGGLSSGKRSFIAKKLADRKTNL